MRKRSMFLGFLLLGLLTGCSNYEEYGKNIMEFSKDGQIEETLLESFEESYYSKEELISSIEAEVSSYNDGSESALVALESCEVEEQKAVVHMSYASAEDYAAFNHVNVFHGDISGFVESPYHAYVDLKDMEGGEIPFSSLVASGEAYQVVVVDVDCIVEVSGTICYVSEGVESISKKAADITLDDEAVYAYIVYK